MPHILITGGGRGIGAATAILCGARGWDVSINYLRDEAAAAETAAQVEATGARVQSLQGDMSDPDQITRVWDQAEAAFGPVTGLVNNAGIVAPMSELADMSDDRIARLISVNVTGALYVAREGARQMSRARGGPGGAIVNVSSAAARLGSPATFVDYAASKGAMDTLTLGLAQELAPQGVRVNAVRPGIIETEIHETSHPGQDRARTSAGAIPIRRAGRPEEVAEAIAWLLSDQASYTTGALLDVAGGR